MSRKDYIKIGAILRTEWEATHGGSVWRMTLSIADVFKQDNERFDREKFYNFVFGEGHFDARSKIAA